MIYLNRIDAGKSLAVELIQFAQRTDTVLLALPRGGVPVAFPIAQTLSLPLEVFVVRKLGVPGQEELAMGAIAGGGVKILNHHVINALKLTMAEVDAVAATEEKELVRREKNYRSNCPPLYLQNMNVILVDDGLATGASMKAAVEAAGALQAKRIFVAVPVAERQILEEFRKITSGVFCPSTPSPFHGVGEWYEDFSQTSDEEVTNLLQQSSRLPPNTMPDASPGYSASAEI